MTTRNNWIGHSIYYRRQGHKLLGFTLAVIGMVWLARKVGWLPAPEIELTIILPVVFIAMGLFIALHTHHPFKMK